MPNKVAVIKLINNESIIGIINEEDYEKFFLIKRNDESYTNHCLSILFPFKINIEYDPRNRTHALYLEDWLPYSLDVEIIVPKTQIITVTEATLNVQDLYRRHQSEWENDIIDGTKTKSEKNHDLLRTTKFNDDDVQ